MKRFRASLAALAVAIAALTVTLTGAVTAQTLPGGGSCITCVNVEVGYQDCAQGSDGAECHIFYYEGERWCNWSGTCGSGDLDALDLTAAGTFVSPETILRFDGASVARCSGYVVTHGQSRLAAALQPAAGLSAFSI